MAKRVVSVQVDSLYTKVAVLSQNGKKAQVRDAFLFKTPEHSVDDGFIREKETFIQAFKEEMNRHAISETELIFAISCSRVITREVTVPYIKEAKKVDEAINAQAREFFPMDVSNFVITWKRLEDIKEDKKVTKMRLSLVAIPDSILQNYASFAEVAGYTIVGYDYAVNSAISTISEKVTGKSLVVQLDEQTTTVSLLEDKHVKFQRVTPYGFSTILQILQGQSVLGIEGEREAFDFLVQNDMVFGTPDYARFKGNFEGDPDNFESIVRDSYDSIRENIAYYVRVIQTALEYYKNNNPNADTFFGQIHVVGDGAAFKSIVKLLSQELGIGAYAIGYTKVDTIRLGDTVMDNDVGQRIITAVVGTTLNPLDIVPKDLKDSIKKKNQLQLAYSILAIAVLAGVVLVAIAVARLLMATNTHNQLQTRINELSYIQGTYDENAAALATVETYRAFDAQTKTQNEKMYELITQLEIHLPAAVTVQNISISESSITLNMTSDTKLTAAQLIMNLEEVPFLSNINIPSLSRTDDSEDNESWSYVLTATYVDPVVPVEEAPAAEATEGSAEENAGE